jgi:hypothetical protein
MSWKRWLRRKRLPALTYSAVWLTVTNASCVLEWERPLPDAGRPRQPRDAAMTSPPPLRAQA